MEISNENRVRFRELSYEQARTEMLVHIRYGRATLLSAVTFSVGSLVWIMREGILFQGELPFLIGVPWAILLLAAGSIEATNAKISAHNSYLRNIEERYQSDGQFEGFEWHYRKFMTGHTAPFLISEKIWLRVFLVSMAVLEAFFVFAER